MDDTEKKMIINSIKDNLNKLNEVFVENKDALNRDLTTIFSNNLELGGSERDLVEKLTKYNLFPTLRKNINECELDLVEGTALHIQVMDSKVNIDKTNESRFQSEARNYINDHAKNVHSKIFRNVASDFTKSLNREMQDKLEFMSKFDKSINLYEIEARIENQMEHYLNDFFDSVYEYANRLMDASTLEILCKLRKTEVKEIIPKNHEEKTSSTKDKSQETKPFIFNKIASLFGYEIINKDGYSFLVNKLTNEPYPVKVNSEKVESLDDECKFNISFTGNEWTFTDNKGRTFTKYADSSFLINGKYGIKKQNNNYCYTFNGDYTGDPEIKGKINGFFKEYPSLYADISKNDEIGRLLYLNKNVPIVPLEEEDKTKEELEEVSEIKFDTLEENTHSNEFEGVQNSNEVEPLIDDDIINKRIEELCKTPDVKEFLDLLSMKGMFISEKSENPKR